jgi:hypothetical protein
MYINYLIILKTEFVLIIMVRGGHVILTKKKKKLYELNSVDMILHYICRESRFELRSSTYPPNYE